MMGQLADGLTAVGNHYALLLVGMVELLVAVMFLLGRVLTEGSFSVMPVFLI